MYKRIFLDTNPIIYYLNSLQPYAEKITDFFVQNAYSEYYTSTVTDIEFLVKPYQLHDFSSINAYWDFLGQMNICKSFVSERIAVSAAQIRAEYKGVKLADSIQLAASIDAECDCFFTNDERLKQVARAQVVYLGDL